MNLFSFLVLLLYVACFSIAVFIIYRVFFPPVRPITITMGWWPWSVTQYNHWPSWHRSVYGTGKGSYGDRCPSGSCSAVAGSKRDHFTPPWGGSGRGANGGGFHSSEKIGLPSSQ